MPRVRRGADEDGAQQIVLAVVAVSRVIGQRKGIVSAAGHPLQRHPILIRLLIAGGRALQRRSGHFGEDFRRDELRRHFQLQNLLMLVPVDHKPQFNHIGSGELRDVDRDV